MVSSKPVEADAARSRAANRRSRSPCTRRAPPIRKARPRTSAVIVARSGASAPAAPGQAANPRARARPPDARARGANRRAARAPAVRLRHAARRAGRRDANRWPAGRARVNRRRGGAPGRSGALPRGAPHARRGARAHRFRNAAPARAARNARANRIGGSEPARRRLASEKTNEPLEPARLRRLVAFLVLRTKSAHTTPNLERPKHCAA